MIRDTEADSEAEETGRLTSFTAGVSGDSGTTANGSSEHGSSGSERGVGRAEHGPGSSGNGSTTDESGTAGRRAVADQPSEARPETILLPVGGSDERRVDRLVDTTAELAGTIQATVHVLHVFAPSRFETVRGELTDGAGASSDGSGDTQPDADALAERVTAVRAVVDGLAPRLHDWGTTMTVGGRVGDDVAAEVVAAAEAHDAKRVVVGGRSRTPAGKVVFGSTAQAILLDAPCPVTFVRGP